MRIEKDEIVLSSGRRFYAHGSILGLRASGESDEHESSLFYGYDGQVHHSEPGISSSFTPDERREIAKHMIELWKKWGG